MKTLHLRSPYLDMLSYQARTSNGPDNDELEEIVNDMCVIRSDWERYSDKRPRFIRRRDLILEVKGWFELVRRSILPASNNYEVNIARATMVHCLMKGGDINVHKIIAEGIQDAVEKNDPSAQLWYPSTILRLCMKAKVIFEDSNPKWVNPGRLVLQRITFLAPTQQQRRPQIRKRTSQEEHHQEEPHQEEYQQEEYYDPSNINLNHIQGAIEDLARSYMEGQEQQLPVQSQRMDRQEELLSNWMNQQREWQKQQMEQQQEHYSQLTEAIDKPLFYGLRPKLFQFLQLEDPFFTSSSAVEV
ncbi:uncharacterized protein LOC127742975 [Arachis duranensis]|uniref:Uncharacterized protein LOC127742975 n=1 Tax=Arachis duranensis TaxID=130453 RepID=A0A9C6TJ92_ARADU|nr:uncharacterized protein LOC127742975 [Arachis duranensis]